MPTTRLQITQAAGVDYGQPQKHFTPGATTGYLNAEYDFLVMPYPAIPETLKFKNINSAYFYFYASGYPSSNYSEEYTAYRVQSPFDPSTATHNDLMSTE